MTDSTSRPWVNWNTPVSKIDWLIFRDSDKNPQRILRGFNRSRDIKVNIYGKVIEPAQKILRKILSIPKSFEEALPAL